MKLTDLSPFIDRVPKGKSDTDIGMILGISHTTAHFYIERAKGKLGVRTHTLRPSSPSAICSNDRISNNC